MECVWVECGLSVVRRVCEGMKHLCAGARLRSRECDGLFERARGEGAGCARPCVWEYAWVVGASAEATGADMRGVAHQQCRKEDSRKGITTLSFTWCTKIVDPCVVRLTLKRRHSRSAATAADCQE